ncbi:hypothetical protein K7432_006013 [Basidiobolus ranarum]|uniref:Uncharacterized protein n=1 Tax=Basidiobolus ranarum TaxID=34480 RepID=A0ABR2W2N6_9FUNG
MRVFSQESVSLMTGLMMVPLVVGMSRQMALEDGEVVDMDTLLSELEYDPAMGDQFLGFGRRPKLNLIQKLVGGGIKGSIANRVAHSYINNYGKQLGLNLGGALDALIKNEGPDYVTAYNIVSKHKKLKIIDWLINQFGGINNLVKAIKKVSQVHSLYRDTDFSGDIPILISDEIKKNDTEAKALLALYKGAKCPPPKEQSPFNNKGISINHKSDPATFDSNSDKGGITALSMLEADLEPGKVLGVNGFKYELAQWGRGKNDHWIEAGQKVKVATIPGANRLGFLLASDVGHFGGKFEIVYADCSHDTVSVGASDWKWKVDLAPGNTVAQGGLRSTNGNDEVRLFSTEVPINASKGIAYVRFPKTVYPIRPWKGHSGHIHVFAIATKKV